MTQKIKITLSPFPLKAKPNTKEQKEEEHKRINRNNTVDITLEELGAAILNGQTFCHGVFSSTRANQYFVSTDLIVLDIDNKDTNSPLRLGDALNRLKENGMDCNMAYTSFSDELPKGTSDPKLLREAKRYRLIFKLPRTIRSLKTLKSLLDDVFYLLFPEADKCAGIQHWYGGKNILPVNMDYELDGDALCLAAAMTAATKYSTRKARNLKFNKIAAIPQSIMGEDEIENDPNTAKSFNIIKKDAENGSFPPIRNFDWEFACSEFQLLDDFINGKRKVDHTQLLPLYRAMVKIEGGKEKWKESVRKNPYINNEKVSEISYYFDRREQNEGYELYEQRIATYAPDDPAAEKYLFLTHISKKLTGTILEDNSDRYYMPLTDAENALGYFFPEVKADLGNGQYVFNCATGLGKSKEITKCRHLAETLIAVPTHDLKDEFSKRLTEEGIEHFVTPQRPELPDSIRYKYETLNKNGATNRASSFLKSIANSDLNHPEYGITNQEFEGTQRTLKSYFEDIENCQNTTLPVITTHKKLFTTEFPHHSTIIIDEDVIPSLFEIKSTTTKDLRVLINRLKREGGSEFEDDIQHLENFLDLVNTDYMLKVTETESVTKNLSSKFAPFIEGIISNKELPLEGSILGFFHSDFFFVDSTDRKNDPDGEKTISYLKTNSLPEDKKIIILSATANEEIYRRIFGSLEWFGFKNVKQVGKLTQVYDLGLSRSWMASRSNRATIEQIKEMAGEKPVITFLKYKPLFYNTPNFSLESCEGFDSLRGKDIFVVGTPHIPVAAYALLASALGYEFSPDDLTLKRMRCKDEGITFDFVSFQNPDLQKVQFYKIESALIQACGRARTIREDCQVVLFSKFPLAGFKKMSLAQFQDQNQSSHPDPGEGNSPVLASGNVMPSGSHSSVNSVKTAELTPTPLKRTHISTNLRVMLPTNYKTMKTNL